MLVVQALAAELAGVSLRYHVPPKHVFPDGHADVTPALELLKTAAAEGLTVAETLDRLAARCEDDPRWRTKYRPPRLHQLWGQSREPGGGKPRPPIPPLRMPWPFDPTAVPDPTVVAAMMAVACAALVGGAAGAAAGASAGAAAARAQLRRGGAPWRGQRGGAPRGHVASTTEQAARAAQEVAQGGARTGGVDAAEAWRRRRGGRGRRVW